MGKSRLGLRREAEAAEALEKEAEAVEGVEKVSKTKAKGATKKKAATKRTREKPPERKRAVWVIYSGSMKEEGRYPYQDKAAAEERLEQLRQKSKRLYFIQMLKELIIGDSKPVTIVPQIEDEDLQDEIPARGMPVDAEEEPLAEAEEDEFADEEDEDEDGDEDEEPVEEEEE